MRVAVIIPAHNEARLFLGVINTLPSWIDHVILVDDASTDGTCEKVLRNQMMGFAPNHFHYLRNTKRLGVGGTIMNGHMEAKRLGSDVDIVMAGDGQMDPKELPRLLKAIEEGADYAKGNRFLLPSHVKGMPTNRIIGNRFLSLMMKPVSGYWHISDPQNGYTALRTSMLDKIQAWHIWKGYFFENDMLIHLNVVGAKVVDVAISARYEGEKSQIMLKEFTLLTLLLLSQRLLWRLRQ
jgi:glycosyltransferase involved in cell wall biosynthesis